MLEFSRAIHGSQSNPRIDRSTLELISAVTREEMNMKMRCGIPMHFIVHFHRLHDSGDGSRELAHVSHERRPLGFRQLLQLNSVPAKDQTRIAADWIVRADQNPGGFELDTCVLLAQADLTVHRYVVFPSLRDRSGSYNGRSSMTECAADQSQRYQLQSRTSVSLSGERRCS